MLCCQEKQGLLRRKLDSAYELNYSTFNPLNIPYQSTPYKSDKEDESHMKKT